MIQRRGPKYPKNSKTRGPRQMHRNGPKTQRTEATATTPGSSHHGLTVVATTARGGCHGLTVVVATPVVALFSALFPVLRGISSGFSSHAFLSRLCFAWSLYAAAMEIEEQAFHSIIIFSIFSSFSLVLERERGSGEDLQGFHTGLRSKDGNGLWMSNFFSFSSLFSI